MNAGHALDHECEGDPSAEPPAATGASRDTLAAPGAGHLTRRALGTLAAVGVAAGLAAAALPPRSSSVRAAASQPSPMRQGVFAMQSTPQAGLPPDDARAVATDAYIYAYSMLYNYKTLFTQAVDPSFPGYVGGFNRYRNYSRVFTPTDTDIVTPNNDTPYSWAWLDLRTEPMVLTVPAMDRYYVCQGFDLYTFNFTGELPVYPAGVGRRRAGRHHRGHSDRHGVHRHPDPHRNHGGGDSRSGAAPGDPAPVPLHLPQRIRGDPAAVSRTAVPLPGLGSRARQFPRLH